MKRSMIVVLLPGLAVTACGKLDVKSLMSVADRSPAGMVVKAANMVNKASPKILGANMASLEALASSGGLEDLWSLSDCVNKSTGSGTVAGPVSDALKAGFDQGDSGSPLSKLLAELQHLCVMLYFLPVRDMAGVPKDGEFATTLNLADRAMHAACQLPESMRAELESLGKVNATITVSTPSNQAFYDKKIVFHESPENDDSSMGTRAYRDEMVFYYRYSPSGKINIQTREGNSLHPVADLDFASRKSIAYDPQTGVLRVERISENFVGSGSREVFRMFHVVGTRETHALLSEEEGTYRLQLAVSGRVSPRGQYVVSLATGANDSGLPALNDACKNITSASACVGDDIVPGTGTTASSLVCDGFSGHVMTALTSILEPHGKGTQLIASEAMDVPFTSRDNLYTATAP